LIGASTGGPEAVQQVLVGLGRSVRDVPILVVQHMPPRFTARFAQHLGDVLGIRVCEPSQGDPVRAGAVYVAPGGIHMGLSGEPAAPTIRLDGGPAVNFCRPSVDVLFRDAAATFGAASLAVILTGMGADGTEGARILKRNGATIVAQDEATSKVWGMPGSIVKAGLAHAVLPLSAIGPALAACLAESTP